MIVISEYTHPDAAGIDVRMIRSGDMVISSVSGMDREGQNGTAKSLWRMSFVIA